METQKQINNDLVVYHLNGTKDLASAMKEWNDIYNTTKDGFKKFLVIDDSFSNLSPYQILCIVEWFKQVKFPCSSSECKVALVDKEGVTQNSFGETACYNRGYTNIRYFRTEESAIQWLSQ